MTKREEYALLAQQIIDCVGGKENIIEHEFCTTRIRFELEDGTLADEVGLKKAGCIGMIRFGKKSVQVVVGLHVQSVYDELEEIMNQ